MKHKCATSEVVKFCSCIWAMECTHVNVVLYTELIVSQVHVIGRLQRQKNRMCQVSKHWVAIKYTKISRNEYNVCVWLTCIISVCPVCLPAFEEMLNKVNNLQLRLNTVEKEKVSQSFFPQGISELLTFHLRFANSIHRFHCVLRAQVCEVSSQFLPVDFIHHTIGLTQFCHYRNAAYTWSWLHRAQSSIVSVFISK